MLNVKIICVGKLKEKFYTEASQEYLKRLSAYCKTEISEVPECKLSSSPGAAEISSALKKEGEEITKRIPANSSVISCCIEGKRYSSTAFSALINDLMINGNSSLVFVIGGSNGLSDEVKSLSMLKFSMSDMTFPHHLARVMLLEQIYRSFKILEGSKYHK